MKKENTKSIITSKIHTSKSRLKGKNYVDKKYVRKYINSKTVKPRNSNNQSVNVKKLNIKSSKLKGVNTKGNTINNIKDYLSEQEDQTTGVQAYVYVSNKANEAINIAKTPIKAIKTINNIKHILNDSRYETNKITTKKVNERYIAKKESPMVKKANIKTTSNYNFARIFGGSNIGHKVKLDTAGDNHNNLNKNSNSTSKINKKYLMKNGGKELLKDSTKLTINAKNRIADNLKDNDGSSGVQAFLQSDKNIRYSTDTVKLTKNLAIKSSDAAKLTGKVMHGSGSYIKERIRNNKNAKYQNIKNNISKSSKIRTGSKKTDNRANSILLKNARKEIAQKHIFQKNTANSLKGIFNGVRSLLKPVIAFANPVALIAIAFLVFFIIVTTSVSGNIVSAISQNYFIAEDEIALKYKGKVESLDEDLMEEIEELRDDDSYDSSRVVYIGDIQGIYTNFQEIFAIAAIEFKQDLAYSNKEEEFIEEAYEKMYTIKISTEIYYVIDKNGEEDSRVRKIITVYTNDMELVMSKLSFNDEQCSWSRRLVSNFTEQFPYLAQQYGELTQEEINNLIQNAPEFSSKKQEKLYETALSIVGKVKYFWGGKSSAGWNDKWGKPTLVTSPGNETTGKYIPLGLDCSGYVDWVYKTAGIGNMLSSGGTAYQWGQSYPISSDELQIGDLAFLQMPNSSGINHAGIYIGKDEDNNNLYAHSQWGTGVTVDGYKGFKYFRRVVRFD
ncbi:MAG: C40 family peptidase [Vulcanibacillus sp.]